MEDKLEIGLARRLRARVGGKIPVVVRYRPELAAAERVTAGAAPRYHFRLLTASAMELTAEQIQSLAADPLVEYVWQDLPVKAYLDTSVPHIRAPQVWHAGVMGHGVRIAILDTGVDLNHPDLQGRIAGSADFSGEGVQDGSGHGTHVAGIAAGAGSKYRGLAPEASIYAAKVLDNQGGGMMSDVIAGLEWAAQQQVHVINISLGSSEPSDGNDALCTACDIVVGTGITICVAAGNDGPGPGTVGSPGAARQVITVGAATDGDQIVSYSSRGPTLDGRVKPDILLPGQGIISCRAANTTLGTPVDNLYINLSGTSMATPHATGAAALLLAAMPALTPTEIKARFASAALNLGLSSNTQGAGRLDVYAAYSGQAPEPPPVSPPAAGCLPSLLGGLFRT